MTNLTFSKIDCSLLTFIISKRCPVRHSGIFIYGPLIYWANPSESVRTGALLVECEHGFAVLCFVQNNKEVEMTRSKRLTVLRLETDAAVKSLILHFSPIDKHRRYLAKLDPERIKLHLSWIVRNLKQIKILEGGAQ